MNMPTAASWAKVAHDANLVDPEVDLDPAVCDPASMAKADALARWVLHEDPRFSKVRASTGYIRRTKVYSDGSCRDALAQVALKSSQDVEIALLSGKLSHRRIPIVWFNEKLEHGDSGHAWLRPQQQPVAHATIHAAVSATGEIPWESLDAMIWWRAFSSTSVANPSAQTKWELYHLDEIDLTDEGQQATAGGLGRTKVSGGDPPDPTANAVISNELRRECISRHADLPRPKNKLRARYLANDTIFDELTAQSDQRYDAIPELAARLELPDPGETMFRFFDPLKTRGRCAGRPSQLNKVLFTEMFPEFHRSDSGIPAA